MTPTSSLVIKWTFSEPAQFLGKNSPFRGWVVDYWPLEKVIPSREVSRKQARHTVLAMIQGVPMNYIVIDESGRIIDGDRRFVAARRLLRVGSIPVIILS